MLGRVWKQSNPFRDGQTLQWTEQFYDALGRTKKIIAADGSVSEAFYNENDRPDSATGADGETVRSQNAWGQERWFRNDARGLLVEVIEPNPAGNGTMAVGNTMQTSYEYNAQGKLTEVYQGTQRRSFRYDSLGRLTHQKMAEERGTLDDSGQYVGNGQWSDVLKYDDRSNLIERTDARGVRTNFNYDNDPLNRIQSLSYDTDGVGGDEPQVAPAATVSYAYMTSGDVSRLRLVTAANVSAEEYAYDSQSRVEKKTLTLASRPAHPLETNYSFDTLDRIKDVQYPKQYGIMNEPRKLVHQDYDVASRLSGLKVNNVAYASEVVYNEASQTTELKVGPSGGNQETESYQFDNATGLLTNQKVQRGATTLLDLSYDYIRSGTQQGRTGKLTKLTHNLDRNKDRVYEYDSLGRLAKAAGGNNSAATPLWTQNYSYDRYGNRTGVVAAGTVAPPSGTPADPSCSSSQTLATEQYVQDFYQGALGRLPNQEELERWTGVLKQAWWAGQGQLLAAVQRFGRSLFNSPEYLARNRADHEYVLDLYHAWLEREPEEEGYNRWLNVLPTAGRTEVLRGFFESVEFSNKTTTFCPGGSAPLISGGVPVPTDGVPWGTRRYVYDAARRLVQVTDEYGSTIQSYTYGADNRRLITHDGGAGSNYRTYYVWEGTSVIAEYSESPAAPSALQWSASYIFWERACSRR
ncbi:MAG: DUF4214 domain-containing protein [Pyrinomonadaceae bacterium]